MLRSRGELRAATGGFLSLSSTLTKADTDATCASLRRAVSDFTLAGALRGDEVFIPPSVDRVNLSGTLGTWSGRVERNRTQEGWLYLATVLDLASRRVVGWAMRDTLETELALSALAMAITTRRPTPGLIHHSDRGSQTGFNRSSQQYVLTLIVGGRSALRQGYAS